MNFPGDIGSQSAETAKEILSCPLLDEHTPWTFQAYLETVAKLEPQDAMPPATRQLAETRDEYQALLNTLVAISEDKPVPHVQHILLRAPRLLENLALECDALSGEGLPEAQEHKREAECFRQWLTPLLGDLSGTLARERSRSEMQPGNPIFRN